jgi:hypothetical protein
MSPGLPPGKRPEDKNKRNPYRDALFAVVKQDGTAERGHYTACITSQIWRDHNDWWFYNDETVTKIEQDYDADGKALNSTLRDYKRQIAFAVYLRYERVRDLFPNALVLVLVKVLV